MKSALMYFEETEKEKLEGGLHGGKLQCSSWKEYIQMCIFLLSVVILFILVTLLVGPVNMEAFLTRRISNDIIKLFDIQSQYRWSKIVERLVSFFLKLAYDDLKDLYFLIITKRQPYESVTSFVYNKIRILSTLVVLTQINTFNNLIGALCTAAKVIEQGASNKQLMDLGKYLSKPGREVSSLELVDTIQNNFSFVKVFLKEKFE
jgi:hypothetical protein